MSKIVSIDRKPLEKRISPSWLDVCHRETVISAQVRAKNLFDRRCLIEISSEFEGRYDQESSDVVMSHITGAYPIIWRDSAGHERIINDLSPWLADRSLYPDQSILCFVFCESKIDPQRAKLIDFRYRVLGPCLMPLDPKSRNYRADILIKRLNEDRDLAQCIEVCWFNRSPNGLSAAEKSLLTNGQICKTKFQPSHKKPGRASAFNAQQSGVSSLDRRVTH